MTIRINLISSVHEVKRPLPTYLIKYPFYTFGCMKDVDLLDFYCNLTNIGWRIYVIKGCSCNSLKYLQNQSDEEEQKIFRLV